MATRACPQCGSHYVASVRRCIDCDVMLVDEGPLEGELVLPSAATPVGDGEEVAYELEGWSNQLKLSLEGMLDREGIRRVWEAAVLVVPAESEAQVDALIATVEGVELEELAEEDVQVAFDLHELTADELEDLDARLVAAGVVHAWTDEVELLVAEGASQVAEEIVDAVINPIDDQADDGGLALQERLSMLFIAVDKLVKDPLDAKQGARFASASEGLEDLGVPYGLSGEDWSSFLALISELRAATAGPGDAEGPGVDASDEADDGGASNETVDAAGSDEDEVEPVADRRSRAHDVAVDLRERLRDLA